MSGESSVRSSGRHVRWIGALGCLAALTLAGSWGSGCGGSTDSSGSGGSAGTADAGGTGGSGGSPGGGGSGGGTGGSGARDGGSGGGAGRGGAGGMGGGGGAGGTDGGAGGGKVDSGGDPTDAGSTLFDVGALLPDATIGDGMTVKGCYACLTEKCKTEVAACDSDPKCKEVALCALIDCKASTTDVACLLGCATKAGVALDLMDPTVVKVLDINKCMGSTCKDACPAIKVPMMALSGDLPKDLDYSIDPRAVQIVREFVAAFENAPEARDQMIKQLSAK